MTPAVVQRESRCNEAHDGLMAVSDHVQELIPQLYAITARLREIAPDKRFTLDGNLVGDIGEVLAAERFNLTLLPASTEGADAVTADGIRVEVKATQAKSVSMRCCPPHLLVLKINLDGSFDVVFNGPGTLAWENAGKMSERNGQRPIGVTKLKQLQEQVAPADRLS